MFKEFVEIVGVILGIGFVLVAGIVSLSAAQSAYSCAQFEVVTGKQTHFVFPDDCYIKTADGFQHWQEYKLRATASEGLKK